MAALVGSGSLWSTVALAAWLQRKPAAATQSDAAPVPLLDGNDMESLSVTDREIDTEWFYNGFTMVPARRPPCACWWGRCLSWRGADGEKSHGADGEGKDSV